MTVNISKEMFDAAVGQLGVKLMMSDVQTIVGYAHELERDCRRLIDGLTCFTKVAAEAYELWDADQDHKVGKLLSALSGRMPKYRHDIDWVHSVIAEFTEAELGGVEHGDL